MELKKRCPMCREKKTLDQYHIDRSNKKWGVQIYCKECKRIISKKRRKQKPPRGETGGRYCTVCNQWKSVDNFCKIKTGSYISHCYDCKNQYQKDRYQNDPEAYAKTRQKWLDRGGKAKINAISRNWMKRHYHGDENYRLAHLIRTSLNHAIRKFLDTGKHINSSHPAINYEEIIEHLGPCPGEYGCGKYTVHHICSLRLFDLTDPTEYAIAVHPKNVRWELSKTNYDLGQSWDEDLYNEIKRELNENTNTRNTTHNEEV